jgi:nucleoside-diphosphate-sugar epimerase
MKVLLTGATGYIGSRVLTQLQRRGHQVTAYGRRAAPGADAWVQGELGDSAELERQAARHDGIVHVASAKGPQKGELDLSATQALLRGAKRGGAGAFIYTSGVWHLGELRNPTPEDGATGTPHPISAYRPAVEAAVREAGSGPLRACVLRPGIVYGGGGGILALWWKDAQAHGRIRVVGEGQNRWPLVHRDDLAVLYALVLEGGQPGAIYHGTDETGFEVMDLARAACAAAGIGPPQPWPVEEAGQELGEMLASALMLDQVLLSPASVALGWERKHPDFPTEAAKAYA